MSRFIARSSSAESHSSETESVPCRLFFILARQANTGVLFRRGPSKWVQMIRWDTGRDRFEPGQWFHGKIYELRCDLSPDGNLMIYFASKFNWRTLKDNEYTYAWTAISKPPYLTALALWPKGDCWHGGGHFQDRQTVWLNHPEDKPHPNHRPKGLKIVPNPHAYGEDGPVLFPRLERDGWKRRQELEVHLQGLRYVTDQPMIHEKRCPDRPLTLVMTTAIVEFSYQFTFTLHYAGGSVEIEGAEWADWDRRGRLVFVRAGKLFCASQDAPGNLHEKELADFNAARPKLITAPAWAKKW